MKSRCVHHIALKVHDLSAMTSFYADVLGLPEILRRQNECGKDRSVWFDCGGVILMLEHLMGDEKKQELSQDESLGWHLLALEMKMSDRQNWKERLKARGVKIENESPFSFYFRDPEGNRLALSHYPETVTQQY